MKTYLVKKDTLRLELYKGGHLTVTVLPAFESTGEALMDGVLIYKLYKDDLGMFTLLFTDPPEGYQSPEETALGRILFDRDGNWIYDGEQLAISEQEQLADYIFAERPASSIY